MIDLWTDILQIIDFIKEQRDVNQIAELDIVSGIWQALMALIDWNAARPDQIESFAVKELSVSVNYCISPYAGSHACCFLSETCIHHRTLLPGV